VPPHVRQRIDEELLQQTLLETRELAQARMAHVEDLADLQVLTPTSWLPRRDRPPCGSNRDLCSAEGDLVPTVPTYVRLEPYPREANR
jgi:hypothetical protein